MHGPALGVIVQSVLDGMPLLPGEYTPAEYGLLPTPDARAGGVGIDPGRGDRPNSGGDDLQSKIHSTFAARSGQLPTPSTQDATNLGGESQGERRSPGLNWMAPAIVGERDELDPPGEQLRMTMPGEDAPVDWGPFAAGVERWAGLMGRPAPYPLEDGPNAPRLSRRFTEWLMGLPDGWVTDVPGLSYRQTLKALGNGVVWQQAAAALDLLDMEWRPAR